MAHILLTFLLIAILGAIICGLLSALIWIAVIVVGLDLNKTIADIVNLRK
jgi:hypothetical protein